MFFLVCSTVKNAVLAPVHGNAILLFWLAVAVYAAGLDVTTTERVRQCCVESLGTLGIAGPSPLPSHFLMDDLCVIAYEIASPVTLEPQ